MTSSMSRAGGDDVEQVALGVVDLQLVGLAACTCDALPQRRNLIVADHYPNRLQIQPLGQVRGADRRMPADGLYSQIQNAVRLGGGTYRVDAGQARSSPWPKPRSLLCWPSTLNTWRSFTTSRALL